jgi:hypothetical protein
MQGCLEAVEGLEGREVRHCGVLNRTANLLVYPKKAGQQQRCSMLLGIQGVRDRGRSSIGS